MCLCPDSCSTGRFPDARPPIRVTHVMPQIGVGGAESQLCALIAGTDQNTVSHQVVYYSDSLDQVAIGQYAAAGIKPIRVARNKWQPLQFVNHMARVIAANRPHIAQCWLPSGSFWGRLAAIHARVPRIIIACRSTQVEFVAMLRVLKQFRSDRVHYLANSKTGARAVSSRLGIPLERFHVIHNGIDVQRFEGFPDRSGVCGELKIPESSKLVICVARLTAAKDHTMLLRVAQRCRDVWPVHFVLVGHGEREFELRQLAQDMGVSDIVHFLGLRTDVPRLLRSSDMVCFTSRWEGFPNSLVEAMAAGLPIVTTRFLGAEELIEDGVQGLTVPCGDDEKAFEAIQTLIREPDRARLLGVGARVRAQTHFSLETMIRKTLDYYRSILDGET